MDRIHFFKEIERNVQDPYLKQRLTQELQDHLEDQTMTHKKTEIAALGNPRLISKQTNTAYARFSYFWDAVLAVVAGISAFIITNVMLPGMFDVDFITSEDELIEKAGIIFSSIIWCALLFLIYLSFQKRITTRYGRDLSGTVLQMIYFYLPVLALILSFSLFKAFFNEPTTRQSLNILSQALIPGLLSVSLFWVSKQVVRRYLTQVDSVFILLKSWLPVFISLWVTAGILTLEAGWLEYSTWSIWITPLVIPMLLLYFVWVILTRMLSEILHISLITSIGITILFGMLLGIALPVGWMALKRCISTVGKYSLSLFLPIAVILPFLSHDIPRVLWHEPLVWDWQELEQGQLSFLYPWASSLMQVDEGLNVSYGAWEENGNLYVQQEDKGPILFVQPSGIQPVTGITLPEDFLSSLPEGFTCNGESIKRIPDWGLDCQSFAYRGSPVAEWDRGMLVDLDLTPQGLLAISISMGGYDPTYVYVVDISGLK